MWLTDILHNLYLWTVFRYFLGTASSSSATTITDAITASRLRTKDREEKGLSEKDSEEEDEDDKDKEEKEDEWNEDEIDDELDYMGIGPQPPFISNPNLRLDLLPKFIIYNILEYMVSTVLYLYK